MVVSFDRRNFVYEFSNFKSPPSVSVKKQSSLSDTPMPCVTPCVPPVVSPNILSDSSMDDQYKFRERSHAFSYAKPRFSTSEHIIITICVTGNDFIFEPGPSINVCGASLDKDNEIEDFKQSSKG